MANAPSLPRIGVFLPMDSTYAALSLQGLNRAAAEHRLHLVIYGFLSSETYEKFGGAIPLEHLGYDAARLDGTLLFFGDRTIIDRLSAQHQNGHPTVFVLRTGGATPHVLSDDEPLIEAVVRRFHRHGHRRIAFVRGTPGNPSAERRYRGYQRGLAEAGLPLDPELVIEGDFHDETSFLAVGAALARGTRFTAMVASNDNSAFGALRALKARGVSVPDQVELVGYDNRFGSALTDPPLTTIEIPLEEMAYAAMASIAAQLRGEPVPREIMIPPVFINRASTRFTDFDATLDQAPAPQVADGPASPAMLALLETFPADGTIEEVLVAADGILKEAIRLALDLLPLVKAIVERAGDSASTAGGDQDRRRIIAAALGLTLTTTRLTRIQAAEDSRTFSVMTIRLRGLTFETLDDARVVNVLRETLGALGFQQARLYLKTASDPNAPGRTGTFHRWDLLTVTQEERPADGLEVLPAALELSERFSMVFVLPLIVNDVVVGNLVADGDSRFRAELAELIRHVSGALHNLALYRDLAHGNDTLRQSEYFYSSLVQSLPQIILRKDAQGRITYANSGFATLVGRPLDQILGSTDDHLYPIDAARKMHEDDAHILATGESMEYERVVENESGRTFFQVRKSPLRDATGAIAGVQVIFWDVTPFRETEARLRETQRELIDVSRRAGIAEIATGVLHNIGNALNSVNTSAGVIADGLQAMKIESVGRVGQLLVGEAEAWSQHFSQDGRGRKVVDFVHSLETHLQQARTGILGEVQSLRDGVDHVNHIVAAQQEFAQVSGIVEEFDPSEPLEYALRLCETELLRHGIAVLREYEPAPRVRMERHKAVQILVNLLRNAKESLSHSSRPDKQIRVGVRATPTGQARYHVADNGVGIPPEQLSRVFTMGFTTKKNGHGFGLHNCSLIAASLGGSLDVESDGPGKGATFILTLPPADNDLAAPAAPAPPT